VTSTGQNDAGLFEPTLQTTYLPFEGAGAISADPEFKTFDYGNVSTLCSTALNFT